jgi:hypothetical protein
VAQPIATDPKRRAALEPLYDIDPRTGASIEVFYADRTLETFGWCAAGWFWWYRRRGFSPEGPATGPFSTGYAAYRHALGTILGTDSAAGLNLRTKSDGYRDTLAERESANSD